MSASTTQSFILLELISANDCTLIDNKKCSAFSISPLEQPVSWIAKQY